MSTTRPAPVAKTAVARGRAPRGREIASIQAARGVAAVLVVISHGSGFIGQDPGLWRMTPVYLWLRGTALGVQLFFVISGIVILRAHRRDLGRPGRTGSFLWKRFRRIYPLYWILLSLILLRHRAGWAPGPSSMSIPGVVASSYLLIHLFSVQSIVVQAWSLFDEVEFYLVFALSILHRTLGLVVLCLWLGVSSLFITPGAPYWSVIFSPYHLLFGLGILVGLALETDRRLPAVPLLWTGVLVFAAATAIEGPFQRGVPVRLLGGAGAASALCGAALLERRGRLRVPRWLMAVGDASYSIYLVHLIALSVTARFAYAHGGRLPIPPAGWLLLLVPSSVAAGIATHYALEAPLLRWMGRRPEDGRGRERSRMEDTPENSGEEAVTVRRSVPASAPADPACAASGKVPPQLPGLRPADRG